MLDVLELVPTLVDRLDQFFFLVLGPAALQVELSHGALQACNPLLFDSKAISSFFSGSRSSPLQLFVLLDFALLNLDLACYVVSFMRQFGSVHLKILSLHVRPLLCRSNCFRLHVGVSEVRLRGFDRLQQRFLLSRFL